MSDTAATPASPEPPYRVAAGEHAHVAGYLMHLVETIAKGTYSDPRRESVSALQDLEQLGWVVRREA